MRRGLRLFAGAVLAAAAPVAASAQAVSALKGHDSNAPVDVEADRIEVQDRADRAIFSGNVNVKQTDLTMQSARLTVAYAKAAAGSGGGTQIQRLDAAGNVIVTSPTERATGDFGIYDLNRKLITLLGNVHLVRGDSNVAGGRLVIDLNTGRATVDGSAVGGAGGVTGGKGGRVTGRFTVQQKPN
jgi:lipopolysaccharide export system protein LptA